MPGAAGAVWESVAAADAAAVWESVAAADAAAVWESVAAVALSLPVAMMRD